MEVFLYYMDIFKTKPYRTFNKDYYISTKFSKFMSLLLISVLLYLLAY